MCDACVFLNKGEKDKKKRKIKEENIMKIKR